MGFVLPPIWVKEDDSDEDFKKHIVSCLAAQAIAGGILVVLVVLFF